MLKNFDSAAAELRSFLRASSSLSEAEQLFIENRIMMLQMEYTFWAKGKRQHKKTSAKGGEQTSDRAMSDE